MSINDFQALIEGLPRAAGEPLTKAGFRQHPEDFIVHERVGFEFEGRGDHLCLLIEKTGLNTHEVIDRLATALGVAAVDIGYFGLKDRQAITRQWFSIHLPGKTAEPTGLVLGDGLTLLDTARHTRKFRVGSHCGNRFIITLRDLRGDLDHLRDQLSVVFRRGFPNYFAEQRFGHGARNILHAQTMFRASPPPVPESDGVNPRRSRRRGRQPSRRQRGLYLSAARGLLFNLLLARRIEEHSWLTPLPDEKLMLAGTHSFFDFDSERESASSVAGRLASHDIHTSAALWGKGEDILPWERKCLSNYTELTEGLETAGLTVARRALRASVTAASVQWCSDESVVLEFELPAGSYATSLLREVCMPETQSANER